MPRIAVLRLLLPWLVLAVVAFQAGISLRVAKMMHLQQATIGEGNRKPIELWLRQVAAAGVFLKPLGYIGYYSNLKMFDFPGLSSNEVVAARKRLVTDKYYELIRDLKPVWLVLRPTEVERVKSWAPEYLSTDSRGHAAPGPTTSRPGLPRRNPCRVGRFSRGIRPSSSITEFPEIGRSAASRLSR